jgi:polysaccharide deacetylase family protein (PEP-CTERM system associated)
VLSEKCHILTVALEDYFQVGAFNRVIQRGQWYRFESRLERSTYRALDLLDRHQVKATFFILGWIAEQHPELVKEIARRGHEVANRGFFHRSISEMSPAEFRDDLKRSHEALEKASGQKVIGYRVAHQWLRPQDLWALDVLAEEGYQYDSSIVPMFHAFRSEPWRHVAHKHVYKDKTLWEFPLSTCSIAGFRIPIAGGNYFRQFPHALMRKLVAHSARTQETPFVMYFHVWELDRDQDVISAAPRLARLRHYRNLGKLEWVLADYLQQYRFQSIAQHLGIELETAPSTAPVPEPVTAPSVRLASGKTPVTIVIPCYNEELVLPYLANTLRSVSASMDAEYLLRFIFVDDDSSDGTWKSLQRLFGSSPDCSLIRHASNQGVSAAIQSGIAAAKTEIVCSMDCDCTYDPHEMKSMIHLLQENVDLVTASPYHPQGGVRNVPSWRLGLSRGASFLYRRTLGTPFFTYTSCFRVYRKSALSEIRTLHPGFLGIAETMGRLALRGSGIVEYPTTLEVRLLGRSKMKIVKTIIGHLSLLTRLLAIRMFGGSAARKAAPPDLQPAKKNDPRPLVRATHD